MGAAGPLSSNRCEDALLLDRTVAWYKGRGRRPHFLGILLVVPRGAYAGLVSGAIPRQEDAHELS